MKVNNLVYVSINTADTENLIEALNLAADKFDIENKFGQSVDPSYSEMLRDLATEIWTKGLE